MRDYVWLTNPSGTEGISTVYVDSVIGNDNTGNGKRNNPYKTLTKAWTANTTKPGTIVCRGLFSELMTEGTHSPTIRGDYYGAAVFDGLGKYLIYGYSLANMIVLNAESDTSVSVSTNTVLYRGLGRANAASIVGLASYALDVVGVGQPYVFTGNSMYYFGIIGNNTSAKNIVYWKPVARNDAFLLSLGTLDNPSLSFCTIYDAGFDYEKNPTKIRKSPFNNVSSLGTVQNTIFAKTAIILNDTLRRNYQTCLFTSDCKYYYFDGTNSTSGYTEISLEGIAKETRNLYLLDTLTLMYQNKGIASSKLYFPLFNGCIFSDLSSEEIFNNPELGDVTLIPGCDADTSEGYIGALPPAKNIPILTDSTGIKETWDEKSVSGCIIVDSNKIYLDPNNNSNKGSILSKIITINPRTTLFNGIYSIMPTKQSLGYFVGSNEKYTTTGDYPIYEPTVYEAGTTIPSGLYMVTDGEVLVDDYTYYKYESFKTSSDLVLVGGNVVSIIEPNAGDVLYCRCRSNIYKYVENGEVLTRGATYMNVSGSEITYHGRVIVDGESFVCMNDSETAPARLAVVFDDDGVPPSEWVPARFWGEYYVNKENGAIKYDNYGIPYGSGNIRTWKQSNVYKSTLDRKYVQFKIEVTKI